MIKKILITFFGLFVVVIIIGLAAGDDNPTNQSQSDSADVAVTENAEILNDVSDVEQDQTLNQVEIISSESNQGESESSEDEIIDEVEQVYMVTSVTDGDTIEVDIDGTKQKLRLIGIDTPETVDPRKPVECFGREASDKMKELVLGKRVKLEADSTQSDKDKYGRLLRYVFLDDDTFINKAMIEQGFAYEYTYQKPYQYQQDFKQSEQEAKDAKRGLWADGVCESEQDTSYQEPVQQETPDNNTVAQQTSEAVEKTEQVEPAPSASSYDCSGNVYNCGDFSTHNEAQSVFDYCMAQVGSDVHRLDGNDDGAACESLP